MSMPIAAVLCGYEKSGTTVLNEILRRHPRLDSGHEVGVLLAENPRGFSQVQPYFSFFQQTWALGRQEALHCCDTDHWSVFYERAKAHSPVIVDKTVELFDKTPKYMAQLASVLDKVPGVPCVVNVRDPRALMHSWACWSGHRDRPARWVEQNFDYCLQRFCTYAEGYRAAAASGKYRLFLNPFESMCVEPSTRLSEIFAFLGLEFHESYLSFESEHFVYGSTVTTAHLRPYLNSFPESLSRRILAATSAFQSWHFKED